VTGLTKQRERFLSLPIKKVKRVGHGLRNFANYVYARYCTVASRGRLTDARLRGRSPRFVG
jgi:hypothetical protein